MADTVRIGWTTLPSRDEADRLAAGAVEAGLAACAQVEGPVRSHHTWEGEIRVEEEWRVTLKHAASRGEDLQAWILSRHPYAVPQWVAVEAIAVAPAYRAWVLGTR
ncbi:MAG: divalent-cation tolerance protein CutA [Opitutales bacterium]